MKALYEILEPGAPEWLAAEALDPNRLPVHVAIIMDGNGRWAKKRSMPRVAGHRAGVEPVRSAVETCARLGVQGRQPFDHGHSQCPLRLAFRPAMNLLV